MNRRTALLAAASVCALGSAARGDYSVADEGLWPDTWPKELEGLRKQAKTYEGPLILLRRYLIPFTKREEFEAAWPHILAVKSKGAPIILVKGPKTDFFKVEPAGVLIQTPPVDSQEPEEPVPGDRSVRSKWQKTTFIELVVDGKVVDLNRIELPADTPIVDERFGK
jgi:hypothetical protein